MTNRHQAVPQDSPASSAAIGSDGAAALLVIVAGVVAALHVGKLPPGIPVLRAELGLTLVQGGFLLSVMQIAGMALGILAGLLADRMGLRRTMLAGLCLLALGCGSGALADAVPALLAARMVEGAGLLLTVLPAPGLLRRLVREPQALSRALGVWGAYMPTGAALAMLLGPWLYAVLGWRWTWAGLAGLTLAWAVVVWRHVPPDHRAAVSASGQGVGQRLRLTLAASGPWLVALSFGLYSGQWLAVVGFLPSIYAAAGVGGALLGVLTALAAAVNMGGNMASGRLLQRGWLPRSTLWLGFGAMALGSTLAFAAFTEGWPWLRFAGVLLFSGVGGLVPGTLFSLAVRLAPGEQQVAATVGWVQQLSALGQFVGPPVTAALAARAGGWQLTPLFTVACCVGGAVLAWIIQRALPTARS